MGRLWASLLLTGLTLASFAAGGWAANSRLEQIEVAYRQIGITVDGQPVAFDAEPFIHVAHGRTFVPARPLAEALGALVGWDEESSTVQVFTRRYAAVVPDGDGLRWSMPAVGFQIRTPAGFVRQEVPTSALQLASPGESGLPDTVVAIDRLPFEVQTLRDGLAETLAMMEQSMYQHLLVEEVTEAESRLTAKGSATLMGELEMLFVIRLHESPEGHWMLMGLIPRDRAAQMVPVMEAILDSFAELEQPQE